ncbi:bifunctional tetrahydrofolate synthase/dihydrofolate synthase [Paraferrimonas haliotis]|uniref:Dihydrofolate synthase/folylpolyglutamate synthase n=1 Tax=Paraferrimonas haliotis TaxID=2013866 RepID=A0AA37TMT8_9GAMM|nr:bifunctional tetrahydrofolate synthase/dihydrofolate synthase [Paraferrimonas haliotis]GLS82598.1 bifunctional folylpolyglutamate synthase/dihydrofolate synthase [Paraferrimonas haliotis]
MNSVTRYTSQSINDWLDYLMAVHPKDIDLGLTRVKDVAQRMQLDKFPSSKVITVAGTNGKGSCCAILESVLLQSGYTVGVFSSPHFEHYRERVRFNKSQLEDGRHCEAFNAIEQARGKTSLTFFEFSALGALYLFAQEQPNYIILEVGLGGRLDATNIVDADVAIVTSIALDHVEYLGNTRSSIGREKAGITRKGRPAFVGEPDVPTGLTDAIKETGADAYFVGKDFEYDEQDASWQFSLKSIKLEGLVKPNLVLANAATALAALKWLMPNLDIQTLNKGLALASLPGRMEQLMSAPTVIADVAHNPHAAEYLAKQLKRYSGRGKRYAIVGMLKDKDVAATLAQLDGCFDHWLLCDLSGPRAASAVELAEQLDDKAISSCYANTKEAWRALYPQLSKQDMVIVFGSFYTVADFKKNVI